MRLLALPPLALCFLVGCGVSGEFDGCGDESESVTILRGETGIADAQGLEVVDGGLIICGFDGQQTLPNLRTVSGHIKVFARTHGTLNLPSLVSTGGEIFGVGVDWVLPRLEETETLLLQGQSNSRLSLPALTRVRQLEWGGAVDAPELLAVDSLFTGPLVAPKLRRFNHGRISPFGQSELPSLEDFITVTFDMILTSTTVVLPALREAQDIHFSASTGQRAVQSIQMPRLQTAETLTLEDQTNLRSFDVPSLTSLKKLAAFSNPKLAFCDLQALADRTGADLDSVSNGACE